MLYIHCRINEVKNKEIKKLENKMNITIVVPLYNEEESLPELHAWIQRVMKANNYSYEIIFVNDGSTDNSWNVIENIVKSATQIDITLAASVSPGDFFVIANSSESGSAIRIVNAGYTIKTVAGSIKSTDNIILARGETAHFVATSSTILETV